VTSRESGAPGPDSTLTLAVLVAGASVLQVAESLLPHPLPGVRLGLANVITLVALVQLGPRRAIGLAVLRTLVSSLVLGTFLTPTFVLSFGGGVVSALVMVGGHRFSVRGPLRLSLVGISVLGSVAHIATQVLLVFLLFIPSSGVLWLWPWFGLSAVATGLLTGIVAAQAFRRLAGRAGPPAGVEARADRSRADPVGAFLPGDSVLHRVAPAAKIVAVGGLAVVVVVWNHLLFYAALLAALVAFALAVRVPVRRLATGFLRLAPLLAAAFAVPVLFTPWGRVRLVLGPVRATDQGLADGATFCFRIGLLFFATAMLAVTTSPRDLAAGLERLLSPLRRFGLRSDRISRSLTLAWAYFPVFWRAAEQAVRSGSGRKGRLSRMVNLPGDIVADIYLLAESVVAAGPDSASPSGEKSPLPLAGRPNGPDTITK
jgi:heptaprenyl diphosphate synthase